MKKCPKCGSRESRRSHRREIERWVAAVPIRPFRCRKCRRRFWRFEPPTADRLGSLLPVILAAAAAGAVVLYMTSLPYAGEAPPPDAEARVGSDDPVAASSARRFGGVETVVIEDDRLRLKILTGGPPTSWNHFFLARPRRFAVDLEGPWILRRGQTSFLNHALVSAVRADRLGDGVRVEIVLGPTEAAEPAFEETSDGLLVTFARP